MKTSVGRRRVPFLLELPLRITHPTVQHRPAFVKFARSVLDHVVSVRRATPVHLQAARDGEYGPSQVPRMLPHRTRLCFVSSGRTALFAATRGCLPGKIPRVARRLWAGHSHRDKTGSFLADLLDKQK